jgi:hypothetical protein
LKKGSTVPRLRKRATSLPRISSLISSSRASEIRPISRRSKIAELADPLAVLLLEQRIVDPAGEDLHVDDGALDARRHLQRRVLHVLRLLAEDRREQLLLGRELGLALGRDLADQDVASLDPGADADDAALVEVDQRLLGDVGDLARDLLHAALGVADLELELLDVDRGVDVVLDEALGEDDRVLEVVAVPGHERDEQVPPERELAPVGGGAVREDVARSTCWPLRTSGRWLMAVSWLVRQYFFIR